MPIVVITEFHMAKPKAGASPAACAQAPGTDSHVADSVIAAGTANMTHMTNEQIEGRLAFHGG